MTCTTEHPKILASFSYAGLDFYPAEECGAYYAEEDGALYTVPMEQDGSPDVGALHRVTYLESWAAARAVNAILGTEFTPADFPGR